MEIKFVKRNQIGSKLIQDERYFFDKGCHESFAYSIYILKYKIFGISCLLKV